jgi:hypothetical protein
MSTKIMSVELCVTNGLLVLTARKRTVLRTIRITPELNNLLQKDAEAKGTNFNALLAAIIKKYAEWDRYAEKFGCVVSPRSFFRDLIEAAEEEKLRKHAGELFSGIFRAALLLWFGKVETKSYLEMLSLMSKYSGFFSQEVETDGRNYRMTFRHDLGERWSTFIRHGACEGVKSTLGIIPQSETSDNSVVVSFSLP